MAVQGVGVPGAVLEPAPKTAKKAEDAAKEKEAAVLAGDTFEKSDPPKKSSGVYSRDTVKLAQLNASEQAYIQNLQTLVSELLNQSGKSGAADGQGSFSASAGGIDPTKVNSLWDLLVDNGDGTFSFDPSLSVEDQERLIAKAKEDIGEDGYYGVKQTSQRILDFAKAVTGGDPSKIEKMREMAQQAFDSVKELAGGKLPDISQQTYDAVMKGFDEWAAGAAK